MNFTNLIYMILWTFCYYLVLLMVPYALTMLQGISILAPFWNSWPIETTWLIDILLYVIVPFVAWAYAIKSSSPEQQIVVSQ